MSRPSLPSRRAVLALGILALISGAAGLLATVGEPFAGAPGVRLGAFMSFNGLGAACALLLAVVTVAAGLTARRALIVVAGAGHLLGALLVVVGLGLRLPLLGGDGSTLSYFLGLGFGLLALGLTAGAWDPGWRAERAS
jgi:hypothetical protein